MKGKCPICERYKRHHLCLLSKINRSYSQTKTILEIIKNIYSKEEYDKIVEFIRKNISDRYKKYFERDFKQKRRINFLLSRKKTKYPLNGIDNLIIASEFLETSS